MGDGWRVSAVQEWFCVSLLPPERALGMLGRRREESKERLKMRRWGLERRAQGDTCPQRGGGRQEGCPRAQEGLKFHLLPRRHGRGLGSHSLFQLGSANSC